MTKILAVGASTSRQSINKEFAAYAAKALPDVEVSVIDLNDYAVPMYSVDEEGANGLPEAAQSFVEAIEASDGMVLSLAEHNGSYAAAFKSLFDWATRVKQKVWSDKPMLLLSTSPGGRGGATVMEAAKGSFPHLGGNIVSSFSLPSFGDNFDPELGIKDEAMKQSFARALAEFRAVLQDFRGEIRFVVGDLLM